MQGAPKRQVNAEDMLAELKRALESSTHAPNAPPLFASPAPKSSSPDRESRRSQIDRGGDRLAKPSGKRSIGPRTDLQKSARPNFRRWKLGVAGLALAGVAVICASFALMNKAPDIPQREPSVAAAESPVRPHNEPATSPSAAEPAFMPAPLNEAAALVTSHRIGPDGAPLATAPPTPASPPPPVEAPTTAAPSAASQSIKPDAPPLAAASPTLAPTNSPPPLAEAPKTPAASASPQAVEGGAPIAAAPSGSASAPLAETPKLRGTPTASASNESAQPSAPKTDSKKKPPGKPSPQKPHTTAKASAKPIARAERQSTEPAPPKEPEKSPQPPQDTGSPTAASPVKTASVQQRVTDGVTHAFGYLMHLPGALVPHLGSPNSDERPSSR